MARIRISGHPRFDGDYRAIQPGSMKLGTQMELQWQTGWSNKDMTKHLEQGASLTPVVIWATLWQAGMSPTWAEVIDMENDQLRYVREAADPADGDVEEPVDEADPTTAPTASVRGAGEPLADTPSLP